MINYSETKVGDILKIVGAGAPVFAANGDLVRVVEVKTNGVKVENVNGQTAQFVFNCGAARLEATEWKEDLTPDAKEKAGAFLRYWTTAPSPCGPHGCLAVIVNPATGRLLVLCNECDRVGGRGTQTAFLPGIVLPAEDAAFLAGNIR